MISEYWAIEGIGYKPTDYKPMGLLKRGQGLGIAGGLFEKESGSFSGVTKGGRLKIRSQCSKMLQKLLQEPKL